MSFKAKSYTLFKVQMAHIPFQAAPTCLPLPGPGTTRACVSGPAQETVNAGQPSLHSSRGLGGRLSFPHEHAELVAEVEERLALRVVAAADEVAAEVLEVAHVLVHELHGRGHAELVVRLVAVHALEVWIFVAARGLSLVVVSGGCSLVSVSDSAIP